MGYKLILIKLTYIYFYNVSQINHIISCCQHFKPSKAVNPGKKSKNKSLTIIFFFSSLDDFFCFFSNLDGR